MQLVRIQHVSAMAEHHELKQIHRGVRGNTYTGTLCGEYIITQQWGLWLLPT